MAAKRSKPGHKSNPQSKRATLNTHQNAPQWVYGTHAVQAASAAGRVLHVYATAEAQHNLKLAAVVKGVTKLELDQQFPDSVHQGVAAHVKPLPTLTLEDVWQHPRLIALDQVTDPHNLGAILRSAAAFGFGAVLVPKAQAAPITPAVAKAAAGAVEWVPVIAVNLADALQKLQGQGHWVLGLSGAATTLLQDYPPSPNLTVVLGSEGSGIRPLVAKQCDTVVRIPMAERMESLNVSVAAGIVLHHLRATHITGIPT